MEEATQTKRILLDDPSKDIHSISRKNIER